MPNTHLLRLSLSFWALMGLCLGFSVNASTLPSMYQGSVEVADQSVQARQDAMAQAFEQVIVRLSGRASAGQALGIEEVLQQADNYMLRYGYEAGRNEASGENITLLKVQFDEELTLAAMRKASLPMWIVGRPTVMVWLAVEREGQRVIVNPETAPEIAHTVKQQLQRRGLPMVWPSLDASDYLALSINDMWGLNADKLIKATERYGYPVILAGQLTLNESSQWQGNWITLGQNEQRLLERGDSNSLRSYVASAVDDMAESLVGQFGVQVRGGEQSEVTMLVEGVQDFSGYQRVLTHLRSIGVVRNLQVTALKGQAVQLRLSLDSSAEQFVDAMETQALLRRISEPEPGGEYLVYEMAVSNVLNVKES